MGNAGPQAPPGRMEGRTSDGGTAFVPEYGAFGASCLTAEPGAGTIVLLQPGSAGACFVHLRQSRLLDMFERSSRERNRKNRLGASLKTFSNCGFCLPAGEKRLGKGFSGWKAALNPALPGRNTAVRRETVIVLEGAAPQESILQGVWCFMRFSRKVRSISSGRKRRRTAAKRICSEEDSGFHHDFMRNFCGRE